MVKKVLQNLIKPDIYNGLTTVIIKKMKIRFNINNAKKCGAKTRVQTLCKSPAMKNGRCRLHGGRSTGARTVEGIEKIKKANLKHGKYTKEYIMKHREDMTFLRYAKKLLEL